MRKRIIVTLCLVSVIVISGLGLTGCGSKGEEVVAEETVAETDMYGNVIEDTPVDAVVEEVLVAEETEAPTQQVGIAFAKSTKEVEEEQIIPIDEFSKYGKVSRSKEGFRILQKDGTYVTDSLLMLGDNCYFFDEAGYMSDNVFVPRKSTDGSVDTFYVHNYKYQYGFIEVGGHKYYIDEKSGRLEGESKVIEGETYYFDKNGRNISKAGYEKMLAKDGSISLEGSLDANNESVAVESVAVESVAVDTESDESILAETTLTETTQE